MPVVKLSNGSEFSATAGAGFRVVLTGPSGLVPGADGSLYIITRDLANEYGYAQGSVHLLKPRQPSDLAEPCASNEVGCWEPPLMVVRSVSNPRGLAIDQSEGMLYVLEQNTLKGFNYETFHGDVLAFCSAGNHAIRSQSARNHAITATPSPSAPQAATIACARKTRASATARSAGEAAAATSSSQASRARASPCSRPTAPTSSLCWPRSSSLSRHYIGFATAVPTRTTR